MEPPGPPPAAAARPRGRPDDRHARLRRTPSDPRRRPPAGYRPATGGRFARLVTEATSQVPGPVLDALRGGRLRVVELPPAGAPPTLGTLQPGPRRRVEVTLHRRPLEARATDRADLLDLLVHTLVDLVADHQGWSDDDLDAMGWDPLPPV